MGPCEILYLTVDKRIEIADFLYSKELLKTSKKGTYWEVKLENYIYTIGFSKTDIELIEEDLQKLSYEDIDKDWYVIEICAPSKTLDSKEGLEKMVNELRAHLGLASL